MVNPATTQRERGEAFEEGYGKKRRFCRAKAVVGFLGNNEIGFERAYEPVQAGKELP
ncbi:hypothetical protein GCM10007207_15880 [Asaia siamensis]|uniref:Transposase n=1 Tax=Asaia siamensis TaxID=110479 RepID=A0ABQ1LWJ8_9PROT|nr:hypothetical protein AA0323_0054 [Asaia siamensis NRIC 0323]GGC31203.1 hypothetical protein GCM10007207_15880 [Asaia siamensis]